MYCGHMGVERPENWNFYLAFAFFRLAVMLQGRLRGSLAGEEPSQASCALHSHGHRAASLLQHSWLLFVLWGLFFPGRTEQRPKLGAQSCVLQMELSDLPTQHQPCQGTRRELVRALGAVWLHTSGVALEPLSELN